MTISIQPLSFRASDKLMDFTVDKVSKLGLYSERNLEAQVVLKIHKSDTRNNKLCELKLAVPGNDLFASRQCASFEGAILSTVAALKQQLKSRKEKKPRKLFSHNADFVESEDLL